MKSDIIFAIVVVSLLSWVGVQAFKIIAHVPAKSATAPAAVEARPVIHEGGTVKFEAGVQRCDHLPARAAWEWQELVMFECETDDDRRIKLIVDQAPPPASKMVYGGHSLSDTEQLEIMRLMWRQSVAGMLEDYALLWAEKYRAARHLKGAERAVFEKTVPRASIFGLNTAAAWEKDAAKYHAEAIDLDHQVRAKGQALCGEGSGVFINETTAVVSCAGR